MERPSSSAASFHFVTAIVTGVCSQLRMLASLSACYSSDVLVAVLIQKMSFTEVHGDLFTSSDSLVHCVSRDLHMGKGIATEFKKQFGGLDDLRQQSMLVLFYLIWMLTAFIQIRLASEMLHTSVFVS